MQIKFNYNRHELLFINYFRVLNKLELVHEVENDNRQFNTIYMSLLVNLIWFL